ncbi:WHG domain-containing protein [Ruania suaedae]|uniref:TetR/AcrR family transcriptional regulator n=1 Tax=Ruania suaedae TaxID=2897774 RepID=UPI001E508757|nr:TetR-like C-terminal domain-containing protein [Ruania suaedae]UFU04187.1 WHG domain-containing protein [Ruania suaedae]
MARPRRYDDAVRRRLLDHASRLVSTHGADGVSLRRLAADAETTTAAVYALFGGRDELVAAVIQEGLRRFAAHLVAAPRTGEPAADLFALGLAYRRSALDDPHFYQVMFGSGLRAGADSTAEPTFLVLRDAVARRYPRATEAATTTEAIRLWALVHGLVGLELAGLLPGDAEERERRYRAALTGSAATDSRVGGGGDDPSESTERIRTPRPPG